MQHDITAAVAGAIGLGATDAAIWERLRRFERTALPIIRELWDLETVDERALWPMMHATHRPEDAAAEERRVATAVTRLRAACGADTGPCAAALAFHTQLWMPAYERSYHDLRRRVAAHLLLNLANACLVTPFPGRATAIARRIIDSALLAGAGGAPTLSACVTLLLDAEPEAGASILDALTCGDDAAAWAAALALAEYRSIPTPPAAMAALNADAPAVRLGRLWREQGSSVAVALLRRLQRLQRLDGPAFQRLLVVLPDSLSTLDHALAGHTSPWYRAAAPVEEPLRADLVRLLDTAVWPLVSDLRPETWPVLRQLSLLRGGRFLLRLLEEVDRLGLARLSARGGDGAGPGALLQHLLGVTARRPDEDDAALVPLLRQVGTPALVLALPHAPAFTAPLCAALGWEAALPLIATLRRLEAQGADRSLDPSDGVIAAVDLRALVAPLDPHQYDALLAAFATITPSAITLVRAALGENRSELRRQLGRRKLLAARALGLLPITGPDDLRQRYLLLARMRQEAGAGSVSRRPYERAAAAAGLRNLALNAGYSDVSRLEWVMEAQIGTEATTIGRSWQIEGYTLTLELCAGVPTLSTHNGTRALKRRPSAVTRDYAFKEVQAALDAALAQARRYRDALVAAMCHGEPLSAEELDLLRTNPIAVALLERLVLIDADGAVGLYRADDQSLEGLHGERVRLRGAATVAHPYALATRGLLADWQAEVVRRQIVQPFKQVFRELYVLTPAEATAGYASLRLAERRLRGRQAAAVLANLGWVLEGALARRPFSRDGIAAHFETGTYQGYGYDPDETDDAAMTGSLTFWPLRGEPATPGAERRIRLADVPPLVLSEALRDLDMVTAVAHASEEGGTSHEVLQRRGELVRTLAAATGLRTVTVEGRAVLVQGSRASYRVSLATGAVYLSSGQYLCIVPAPKDRRAIYLPFAEGGEPVTSEIVSKVLLLSNDGQIRDPTILAQIAALPQAA